jgi:hypothetical protein
MKKIKHRIQSRKARGRERKAKGIPSLDSGCDKKYMGMCQSCKAPAGVVVFGRPSVCFGIHICLSISMQYWDSHSCAVAHGFALKRSGFSRTIKGLVPRPRPHGPMHRWYGLFRGGVWSCCLAIPPTTTQCFWHEASKQAFCLLLLLLSEIHTKFHHHGAPPQTESMPRKV